MTPSEAEALRAYPAIADAWQRLSVYLGPGFRSELTDYHACCAFVEEEFARHGPNRFYQRSEGYLYELTHFHFTPYKQPFFAMVAGFAQAHGLSDMADVGCGVGLDAQALMAAGYGVTLYDVDCPSLRYAAWRLHNDLGISGATRGLSQLGQHRHDLAYAVDVLEHIPDPAAAVERLFAAADHVAVNVFPHDADRWDGSDMHYPLNHWSLLPAFSARGDLLQLAISGETVAALWRGSRH